MIQITSALLFLAFLSSLTCYLRPDYNPILFFLAYWLWNFKPHSRCSLLYIILWSILVDIMWTLVHLILWKSDDFAKSVTSLNDYVLILATVICVLKMILVGTIAVVDGQLRKQLTLPSMVRSVKQVFG